MTISIFTLPYCACRGRIAERLCELSAQRNLRPISCLSHRMHARRWWPAERSGTQEQALVVRLPTSPQKLNTLRVPVQTRDRYRLSERSSLGRQAGHGYSMDCLRKPSAAKNNRLVLTAAQANGKSEHYLSGELVNFGLDGPGLEVVVTYDAVKNKTR